MFGSDVSDNITLDMQVRWGLLGICLSRPVKCDAFTHVPCVCDAARPLSSPQEAIEKPSNAHMLAVLPPPPQCCVLQIVSPRAPPTILSMWLVIINPISKLALTLAPVAMALEVSSWV